MRRRLVACYQFALAHFEGIWTLDECRGLAKLMIELDDAPPRAYVRVLRAHGERLRQVSRARALPSDDGHRVVVDGLGTTRARQGFESESVVAPGA